MSTVEHDVHGRGEIKETRYGHEYKVLFEDGIARWIKKSELRIIRDPSTYKLNNKSTKASIKIPNSYSREIIESLRLGVVPHSHVEKITFGREKELFEIEKWLNLISPNQYSEGTLAIIGDYGSGKTHLLENIYSQAISDGWAVSTIEIDQHETTFFKPHQVYKKIIKNFRFYNNNQKYDFREFIRLIQKKYSDSKCSFRGDIEDHDYLFTLINSLEKIYRLSEIYDRSDENVFEWIEGDSDNGYIPKMYKSGTASNIYCYIINGISWAAHELLGLKGLLLLFDEAEYISQYNTSQIGNSMDLLKGLIYLSNNSDLLKNEIIRKKDGFSRGIETNLRYCKASKDFFRYSWGKPSYLKVVYNFTLSFDIINESYLVNVPKKRIELERINDESLNELLSYIFDIYEEAYNIDFEDYLSPVHGEFNYKHDIIDELLENIPQEKMRLFLKGMIEALDLLRYDPNVSIEV